MKRLLEPLGSNDFVEDIPDRLEQHMHKYASNSRERQTRMHQPHKNPETIKISALTLFFQSNKTKFKIKIKKFEKIPAGFWQWKEVEFHTGIHCIENECDQQ